MTNPRPEVAPERPVHFGVIGLNHNHVYGMVDLLMRAGATPSSFYAPEPELAAPFASRYPQFRQAVSETAVLEDPTTDLIVISGIPADRGPLGVRIMQHGKDVLSDKPGFTTLGQLADARRVQAETGRIYSICYSERLEVGAAVRAGELVKAGAIGRVLQTIGLGPHRINAPSRPAWFFVRERYGGILTDIASHQIDQFLSFTGSTTAEVVASQVGNLAHPDTPELEDFGDVVLHGDGGLGYARVDWFTPDGLGTWGDGRLTILGTEGYIELRKYVDPAGRDGGNHLFLVDGKGIHYINCAAVELPFGRQLLHDVIHRTETAMPQAHCFLAMQLALEAEARATRVRG